MNAPCLNCSNRKLGCHASCEVYKSFAENKTAENEELRERYDFQGHTQTRKRYRSADLLLRHNQVR